MDRSPLAFLPQNNHFNTFPHLVHPKSSPRSSSPSPVSSTTRLSPPKLSPAAKRKASFQDDNPSDGDQEDSVMSTSPQPHHRTLKRARGPSSQAATSKRPLPVTRLLDNLEKPALVTLLSSLMTRHPELAAEVQSLAPKVTPQTALQAIHKLEETFHAAFPYGGDKSGEYAYSRIQTSYNALLQGVADYVTHFLPPSNVNPPELLSFLDSVTEVLHRIPTFHNHIHNLARQSAFADIAAAWQVGIRYFIETNGAFSFSLGGMLGRLEGHAQKEESLRSVVESAREHVPWQG
jgi:protein Cut8